MGTQGASVRSPGAPEDSRCESAANQYTPFRAFEWEASARHPSKPVEIIRTMAPQHYELPFSQAALDDLRERLRRTRWPDQIPGSLWEYGFDVAFLQDICRY